MKTTITVTTEHGTFTRTTARAYAFVVAARGERVDYINAQREAERKSAEGFVRKYRAVVTTGVVPAEFARTSTVEDYRGWLERLDATLATLDATFDARIEAANAAAVAPFSDKGGVWSSRIDLARKEAAKLREFYRDVRVFDVTTGEEVR